MSEHEVIEERFRRLALGWGETPFFAAMFGIAVADASVAFHELEPDRTATEHADEILKTTTEPHRNG